MNFWWGLLIGFSGWPVAWLVWMLSRPRNYDGFKPFPGKFDYRRYNTDRHADIEVIEDLGNAWRIRFCTFDDELNIKLSNTFGTVFSKDYQGLTVFPTNSE